MIRSLDSAALLADLDAQIGAMLSLLATPEAETASDTSSDILSRCAVAGLPAAAFPAGTPAHDAAAEDAPANEPPVQDGLLPEGSAAAATGSDDGSGVPTVSGVFYRLGLPSLELMPAADLLSGTQPEGSESGVTTVSMLEAMVEALNASAHAASGDARPEADAGAARDRDAGEAEAGDAAGGGVAAGLALPQDAFDLPPLRSLRPAPAAGTDLAATAGVQSDASALHVDDAAAAYDAGPEWHMELGAAVASGNLTDTVPAGGGDVDARSEADAAPDSRAARGYELPPDAINAGGHDAEKPGAEAADAASFAALAVEAVPDAAMPDRASPDAESPDAARTSSPVPESELLDRFARMDPFLPPELGTAVIFGPRPAIQEGAPGTSIGPQAAADAADEFGDHDSEPMPGDTGAEAALPQPVKLHTERAENETNASAAVDDTVATGTGDREANAAGSSEAGSSGLQPTDDAADPAAFLLEPSDAAGSGSDGDGDPDPAAFLYAAEPPGAPAAQPSEPAMPQQPAPAAAPVPSGAAARDPIAAWRNMTEAEKIALFS